MNTILSRLRGSQSIETTRAELTRLQSHASMATVWLAELSVERDRSTRELQRLEKERWEAESVREGLVLDLVLRWKEQLLAVVDEDEMEIATALLGGGTGTEGIEGIEGLSII